MFNESVCEFPVKHGQFTILSLNWVKFEHNIASIGRFISIPHLFQNVDTLRQVYCIRQFFSSSFQFLKDPSPFFIWIVIVQILNKQAEDGGSAWFLPWFFVDDFS